MVANRDLEGNLFARELAVEQTLDNLALFSDRVEQAHEFMKKMKRCSCRPLKAKRV